MKKLLTIVIGALLSVFLIVATAPASNSGAAQTEKNRSAQNTSKLSKRNQLKIDQAEQAKLRRQKIKSGAYGSKK